MKISNILFTSAIAAAIAVGFTTLPSSSAVAAGPHEVKGKIEKVAREGREVYFNGKKYRISGSRTNVCIKGSCDQDRGMLKAGMSCKGNTSSKKKGMEFKKLSCK